MKITTEELISIADALQGKLYGIESHHWRVAEQFNRKKDEEFERKYKKCGTFTLEEKERRLANDKDYQTTKKLLEKIKKQTIVLEVEL